MELQARNKIMHHQNSIDKMCFRQMGKSGTCKLYLCTEQPDRTWQPRPSSAFANTFFNRACHTPDKKKKKKNLHLAGQEEKKNIKLLDGRERGRGGRNNKIKYK